MAVEYKTIDELAHIQRLDNYLIKHLKGVPKSLIYRIIRKGNVRVNKGRKKADYKLKIGDIVRIPPIQTNAVVSKNISGELTQVLKNSIIYEDVGLLVINKPSGLASHGGSGIVLGLIEALRQLYGNSLELVHRIDRGTSGCLLIAKKRYVLKDLQMQFNTGKIHKQYWALLKNTWQKKRHTIDAPLLKNTNSRQHKVNVDNKGIDAVSHFHPLKNIVTKDYKLSLVQVVIETGRTHQIRVHSNYAGHPIVGDDRYGDEVFNLKMRRLGINRLCLHAQQLKFFNPTSQQTQVVEATLDKKFLTNINHLFTKGLFI